MAEKKVHTTIKMHIPAGYANPSPPIGPALGQHGINIMDFCKEFNAKSSGRARGEMVPVVVTVYKDRSFTFVMKMATTASLLKKAAKIIKGSGEPNREKAAIITIEQLEEIAEQKMPDFNTRDLGQACKTIRGTARSMGIVIEDEITPENKKEIKSQIIRRRIR